MSTAPPPNVILDLSHSGGQILIATFLATSFWGIQCIQTAVYFKTAEAKEPCLKILVLVLLLFITLHEIFCIRTLWSTLIPKYGDIENFTKAAPQILVWLLSYVLLQYLVLCASSVMQFTLPVAGIVTLLAQWFFTWRIWRFTNKNWIFPAILIPASIGQLVGYLVYFVKGIGKSVPFLATPVMTKITSGIGLLVAIADILIALIMCIILWRSRTGRLGSNRVIVRLMHASVSTGACTAFFAIYGVITSLAFPNDFFYALGLIPIPSLYCNTVLANLNSRKYIQRADTNIYVYQSTGHLVELGTIATSAPTARNMVHRPETIRSRPSTDKLSGRAVVVHVAHETTRMRD